MKQQTSEQLLQQIHEYIGNLSYMREPMGLYDPIEYVLGLGGKRLRPVLMLLAYNLSLKPIITLLCCTMT